jgi:uncharacterized protein Usg
LSDDIHLQLRDYRLTTAEILYHMPDHPDLLQTFIWQDYDMAPRYPVLNRFLGFWVEKIEGRLHSVYVARKKLITAAQFRAVAGEFLIH